MFILIRALDGRIGPAGKDTTSATFNTYDKAFEMMVAFIEEDGGGEYSYDFGNGYSDVDGVLYVYEIFEV